MRPARTPWETHTTSSAVSTMEIGRPGLSRRATPSSAMSATSLRTPKTATSPAEMGSGGHTAGDDWSAWAT